MCVLGEVDTPEDNGGSSGASAGENLTEETAASEFLRISNSQAEMVRFLALR